MFSRASQLLYNCISCAGEKCHHCFTRSVTGLNHREICGQCLDEKYGGV
jgi:hypothetical protein